MRTSATHLQSDTQRWAAAGLATRGDLTGFLTSLCAEIGADSYMLVAIVHDQDRNNARIVASNWMFDAVELAGKRLIARLAHGPITAAPGASPVRLALAGAPDTGGIVDGAEARLLDVLGHAELYSLRLDIGRQRLFLLLSAAEEGGIEASALPRAQIKSCYALSQVLQLVADDATRDPLSDRERECLYWVSEGKTTDEVAVILGVSSNTVNSYVTHAIQKVAAKNRAMAIATAIRSGII